MSSSLSSLSSSIISLLGTRFADPIKLVADLVPDDTANFDDNFWVAIGVV
jgi:hypothetical protein